MTLSTRAIQNIVDTLKNKRHRSSTRKNYYAVWCLFNEFFIRLDEKPESWEDRIILFAGYLVDNNKKANTVKSYVSAIKAVLKADNIDINKNRYILDSLTKACRFQNDKVRTRLPIRKSLLRLIIDKIDVVFEGEQEYLTNMYKCLFSTAYYGLFRVGELTFSENVLRACDVQIADNKMKMKFILRSSKTHWKDEKPQTIKITNFDIGNTSQKYCPFHILDTYIKCRCRIVNDEEQFFIFRDRSPVQPHHMRDMLRKTLDACGLNPMYYSCHSTCAGRVVDLVELMKIPVSTVKILGRWKSNIIYQYLKN